MTLEIVSPESALFKGDVTSVTLPGVDGSFQLLNKHAAIVSILQKGEIKIAATKFEFTKDNEAKFRKIDSQTYALPINSGTIEMNKNKCIVLVD